ncbi:hypothetical protein GEMRC1_005892 [Eukaryota sp. GEM-RC1]
MTLDCKSPKFIGNSNFSSPLKFLIMSVLSRVIQSQEFLQVFLNQIRGPVAFNHEANDKKLRSLLNNKYDGLYDDIEQRCLPEMRQKVRYSRNLKDLSDVHLIALHAYTLDSQDLNGKDPIYRLMNSDLRKGRFHEWNPLLSSISDAFRKCIPYTGHDIYAGLRCSLPNLENKLPLTTFLRDFRSCSSKRSIASQFGDVVLKFTDTKAIHLSSISRYKGEDEWLIAPSAVDQCCYEITNVTQRNGKPTLVLKQQPV